MKKIILSIMFMAFCMSQINAQFHFGIKGVVPFDHFKYNDRSNLSAGWQAGVLFQFKVPVAGIGVQPELLYTVRNASIPVYYASGSDGKNPISYLEVPVNLQWGPDLLLLHPYVSAGPYFGYALSIKGNELKDRIGKLDWGIGLGAGLEVWKFQFEARYTWGLQDVSSVKDFSMKTNSFKLSLGFLF